MSEPADSDAVSRRRLLGGAAVTAGAVAAFGLAADASGRWRGTIGPATGDEPARRQSIPERRPARDRWAEETIGHSVEGRPIHMYTNHAPRTRFTLMVIAAIHGDEPATAPVAREMMTVPLPDHVSAAVVPIANPDGWARSTRANANGIDLNRNFPFWWSPRDGGPEPVSEPETRCLIDTIKRTRPSLVVWIHQPYGYVSAIHEAAAAPALAWARATDLPATPPITQHGGGETWTTRTTKLPSILIEMRASAPTTGFVSTQRRGYEALLGEL